jgi:arginine decarboxylase-like protein
MKKVLIIVSTFLLIGCVSDDDILSPIDNNIVDVPESLVIDDLKGIKVESTIVTDEVKMNIKLPYTGVYRVKIRDISKELISQEKLEANEGDNILKVYVSSLKNNGYTLELTDDNHDIIGITSIVVNN